MPTYEYECQRCFHTFEQFQPITAQPLKNCPKCDGPLRRLIGKGGAIIFKGSGFYATDYRSEEYKKKAREESGGEKKKAEAEKDSGKAKAGSGSESKSTKS
ncbi:zinc ribbon domain-containing protein [bacterium]|nr:zinc ribbon domain-containing protein [bacterium]MCK4326549.1 zinc ribbon domain-containing protein [bacterium]